MVVSTEAEIYWFFDKNIKRYNDQIYGKTKRDYFLRLIIFVPVL